MAFEIFRDDNFIVTEMTEAAARVIYKWKYPAPYEMYSFAGNEEELEGVLNGLHFPVYFTSQKPDAPLTLEDNEILSKPVGFVAWGPSAHFHSRYFNLVYSGKKYIDFAFGLAPTQCDKGLGRNFVKCAADFVKNDWPGMKLRLTVAENNFRARKVYASLGFKKVWSVKKDGERFDVMREK